MSKSYNGRITKWVWDGNVILHEWVEHFEDVNEDDTVPDNLQSEEAIAAFMQAQLGGRPSNGPPEPGEIPLPTTWLFDPDTFAPASKIVGDKHYSIITDHLGTPLSMFDEAGVQTWGAELDIYGVVKNLQGERNDCPFRYPGQYEDCETGFYYNRFRYYDAESGEYVSQDPIGLLGRNPSIYGYVNDTNVWIDIFGLSGIPQSVYEFSKLKELLMVTEKANPLVESLKTTGNIPPNYVTKAQAIANGWEPGKTLGNYVPGGQIGGDIFENTTGLLPTAPGRVWYEADIGLTNAMKRSKQPGWRLLYSSDGLMHITTDHYETSHHIGNYTCS
jgi:RHS repeat-associated protein